MTDGEVLAGAMTADFCSGRGLCDGFVRKEEKTAQLQWMCQD